MDGGSSSEVVQESCWGFTAVGYVAFARASVSPIYSSGKTGNSIRDTGLLGGIVFVRFIRAQHTNTLD